MLRSLMRLAVAGVVSLGCASALTPVAHSDPVGNIVAFGDSYTANPDQTYQMVFDKLAPALIPADYPRVDGCLHSPDNWANRLAGQVGSAVADYSCTAQTSRTVGYRIDSAIAHGDLTDSTRAVVLAVGMNNFGPYGAADGINIMDPAAVRSAFMADMSAHIATIRRVAPTAQIIISGSLTVADPVSATTCVLNVVPNAPAGIPLPVLRDVETWNRDNQRDTAAVNGVDFVDVREASAGNSTCAPDADRGVSGIVDTTSPAWHMIIHPTSVGSGLIAAEVGRALR